MPSVAIARRVVKARDPDEHFRSRTLLARADSVGELVDLQLARFDNLLLELRRTERFLEARAEQRRR